MHEFVRFQIIFLPKYFITFVTWIFPLACQKIFLHYIFDGTRYAIVVNNTGLWPSCCFSMPGTNNKLLLILLFICWSIWKPCLYLKLITKIFLFSMADFNNRTCIYNALNVKSTIQLSNKNSTAYTYLQCTVRWKHYPIKTVHVFTMHCTLKAVSNKNRTCIYNALYVESTIQ